MAESIVPEAEDPAPLGTGDGRLKLKRVRLTDLLSGRESSCFFPSGRLRISASYDDIDDDLLRSLVDASVVIYVEHESEEAARTVQVRECAVCLGEFNVEEDGQTECDPLGCPGRYNAEPVQEVDRA